ncbi:putative ribonuclease H-like domain-containing protein [Tanacetum coccineum]
MGGMILSRRSRREPAPLEKHMLPPAPKTSQTTVFAKRNQERVKSISLFSNTCGLFMLKNVEYVDPKGISKVCNGLDPYEKQFSYLCDRQSRDSVTERIISGGIVNKRDERSIVVKSKARLVAQGFRQEEGIDYDEVFALIARIEAIGLFLAFASYMGFTVYQMDVKSVFLYGTIEEEVYVYQPLGFVDPVHTNKVYKERYHRQNIVYQEEKSDIMLVQVYVDDIIFGSTKKSLCIEFEDCMHKRFQMSSMGELTFFLGLQVKQQPDGIFISQDKSMIGSLMYLTVSSPDIMFVVCACARFQVTPKASYLNVVKRIFWYLKHQPKLGLWYPRDSPFELEALLDSDYGGASLDRKSTTGGCQFLGRRLISWQCKKHTIMANSTTEAEYVAVANCCGQVLWI